MKDLYNIDWQKQYCKLAILPKAIYMFNAILQNSEEILCCNRKVNPEVHMEAEKALNSTKQS
jgi:hypothetical protein